MTKMLVVEDSYVKHAAKLLTIVVSVFLAGYFLEEAIDIATDIKDSLEDYIEISAELLSVFVSFSIFGMTWYAHGKSRDNHSLFLGGTFLLVGFLTLFHTFSYPFMPDFITPNSSNKAAFFLIESRLIFALLFLASAYIYKDTLPKLINKLVLLSSVIAISLISLAFALHYNDYLFAGYNFNSFSAATVFLFSIITVPILYASYLYARKFKETGQKNLIFLIYGSIIILFSNLVYFSFEFSGHFLIIAGFFFMHLALYKSSVELPYEKLALAEEKLRLAAEEKYRNLFENANDAIITADLEDRITSWNKAAEKLFGWTAQEVIGKTLSPLVVPEHLRAERDEIIRNALTDMTFTGIETVRLRKDGKKMDVSLTISPIQNGDKKVMGLSGIIRDITERKRMETELRESEERYRRLFETSQDGLILIDKQTGSIINVNPAIMELLGYSSEEFIGKGLKDVGLLKNIEDFQKTIQELNETGFIHYDDMPVETKEGQSIDTEIYLIDRAKVIHWSSVKPTSHP